MTKHPSCLLLASFGAILVAFFLVSCGATPGGSGGNALASSPTASSTTRSASPTSTSANVPSQTLQLSCAIESAAHPIDAVTETLTCTVTHVSASETSFVLQYTVVNNLGQSHTFFPLCRGALSGGIGSCTQTYSVMVPLSLAKGAVSGSTQPDQYPLGPVVPAPVPGPASTPSIPFTPYATPTPLPLPKG